MNEPKVAREPDRSRNQDCRRRFFESTAASSSTIRRSSSQKKEAPASSDNVDSENPRVSVLQLASHFSRLSQAPKGIMKRFSRSSSHHLRNKITDLERSFSLSKKPSFTSVPSSHSMENNPCHTNPASVKEPTNQTPEHRQALKTISSGVLGSSFLFLSKNSYDVCKSQKNDPKQTAQVSNPERSKIESLITFSTKELKQRLSTRFDTFYSPQKTLSKPLLSKSKLFQAPVSPLSIAPLCTSPETLQTPLKSSQIPTPKPCFEPPVTPSPTLEESIQPSPSSSPSQCPETPSEYEKIEMKRKLRARIKEKVIEMSSNDAILPLLDQGFENRFSFHTDLPPAPGYFKKSVKDYPSRAYINVVVACSSFIMDDPHLNN